MKEIRFTIKGNPDDIEGNPVPYARVVGRALWLPHAKKYHAWKQYVRAIFHRAYPEFPIGKVQPLTTKMSAKALLAIDIYWVNGAHADPDNIFKGIADALFENDKYLDGIFESHYASDGKGRVEVEIYLNLDK
jgi:Holliday junction resolvase RusA-like endonuclease